MAYRSSAGSPRLPLPPLPPLPSPESGPYTHFGPSATKLGAVYKGALELHFDREGARVVASLDLNSGSIVGVTVVVSSGPYPDLVLRAETERDRSAKERGITRETQTGDPRFDEKVYVESDAPEAIVQEMLEDSEVRGAALALIEARYKIRFSKQGIELKVDLDDADKASGAFFRERLPAQLEDAATLARVPRLAGAPISKWNLQRHLIAAPFGFATMLGVGLLGYSMNQWDPRTFWLPTLGGVAGLVLWLPLRFAIRWALRGRSTSHDRISSVQVASISTCLALGAGIAVFVNGAAGGPARELRGRVDEVSAYDSGEDNDETDFEVAWEDGSRTELRLRDKPHLYQEGTPMWAFTGEGALGVRWDRDPIGNTDVVLPKGAFPTTPRP